MTAATSGMITGKSSVTWRLATSLWLGVDFIANKEKGLRAQVGFRLANSADDAKFEMKVAWGEES